ncbi:MAG: glycosyltransferase family 4 protein [Rhodospirillaceae bacterium]|nr:glycosyltransferase family 4 protein [Rhodospirillaceae bacterium]
MGEAVGVKTLLFLVAEDYFFVSHRMTLARAARDAGYRVVVATRIGDHAKTIEAEGFKPVPVRLRRGLRNPFADIAAILDLVGVYRRERPDIVHHLSLKPVVFGTIAARLARVPVIVNALTGLGLLYSDAAGASRWLRGPVSLALRVLSASPRVWTLLQNSDDLATLRAARVGAEERSVLIRGSGVDVRRFSPTEEMPGTPVAAMVARLVRLKGVTDLVAAARLLKQRGTPLRVALVGSPDPDNPTSVTESEIRAWVADGVVEWWGQRSDIPRVWAEAAIAVQPSRGGEGVPKALLEAAACARPLVTTDVPGCRELVRDGVNGLVVPPENPEALADALARLAADPELRRRLGREARRIVEAEHTDVAVASATLEIYRRALSA